MVPSTERGKFCERGVFRVVLRVGECAHALCRRTMLRILSPSSRKQAPASAQQRVAQLPNARKKALEALISNGLTGKADALVQAVLSDAGMWQESADLPATKESAAEKIVKSIPSIAKQPIVLALPAGKWQQMSWLERLKLFEGLEAEGQHLSGAAAKAIDETVAEKPVQRQPPPAVADAADGDDTSPGASWRHRVRLSSAAGSPSSVASPGQQEAAAGAETAHGASVGGADPMPMPSGHDGPDESLAI